MSDKVSFQISYDGEALRNNVMDVRDLAPALLSLGQLFEEANRVINEDRASIRLQVKAQGGGCFQIGFELVQTIGSQAIGFLTGDPVTSAVNLFALIGVTSTTAIGLFKLIKWLKGGKPTSVVDLDNGLVRLTANNQTLEVRSELLRLYRDISVRKSVEDTLKPLENPGISSFEIIQANKVCETVTKEEVGLFKTPEIEDEQLTESRHQAVYSIVSLAFKEDNKWRLNDGTNTLTVAIKDQQFLDKVNRNMISFAKGDLFRCEIRTLQWRTGTQQLKTEYDVLKVIEQIPAPRQLPLLDDEKTPDKPNNTLHPNN